MLNDHDIKLVAQPGVEPRKSAYETDVIPFHYRAESGHGSLTLTVVTLGFHPEVARKIRRSQSACVAGAA
jgi:hypothetical protein